MAKVFVDTNILIYSLDQSNPGRQKKARSCLEQMQNEEEGVISTQVMQEFYVAATKKLGVEPLTAKGILRLFENFEVVVVTASLIKDAIDCHILNQISFWDALIVMTAESAQCEKIWTEDLNDGQTIQGVRIENPLK